MSTAEKISAAEHKIAAILEKLEAETNMVLDTIKVKDIEVTTLTDDRPQWIRHMRIEMYRLPGTRWGK